MFLDETKLEFDFIGITESRISKTQSLNNISLPNHSIEHRPTKATAGGGFLYINKKHSYKICPDLTIYKAKKLESIFVEIIPPKKSNIIGGCIYKHPSMDKCTFNDHYLNPSLENLSKEQNKKIFLLGDFNIDLLSFDTSHYINEFLDNITSSLIHKNLKTLIDIFFVKIQ